MSVCVFRNLAASHLCCHPSWACGAVQVTVRRHYFCVLCFVVVLFLSSWGVLICHAWNPASFLSHSSSPQIFILTNFLKIGTVCYPKLQTEPETTLHTAYQSSQSSKGEVQAEGRTVWRGVWPSVCTHMSWAAVSCNHSVFESRTPVSFLSTCFLKLNAIFFSSISFKTRNKL